MDRVGRDRTIRPSALLRDFRAFGVGTRSGVNVAAGDINGDGRVDVIAGAGPGSAPRVKVFSGADRGLLANFLAYDARSRGGVSVAAGNVKGHGYTDVITGAGRDDLPRVKVFSSESQAMTHDGHAAASTPMTTDTKLTQVHSFLAYTPRFRGGVRVASAVLPGVLAPYGTSRDGIVANRAVGDGLLGSVFESDGMGPA